MADATARGVMVANLPGSNAQSVAEYCAMAMLMLARDVVTITSAIRTEGWDSARAPARQHPRDTGATLSIVSVEIGSRVAKIARHGFGMRVLGHQRRQERIPAEALPTDLDELVAASDFVVSVTCPLTPQTLHLFDQRRLSRMKKTAWLINVGRGAVVQERALVEALRERRIAGAMLDVYEHFRLTPGHELFALDNVILTPHLAGTTIECNARMAIEAAKEMLRMLAGERPENLVNPECLDKREER